MVKQKFMQFFDISTATTGFQTFTINAGGPLIKQRLAPFFQAYKYYKLGRVNVKCVPAATLPVDPTGLSYEAGENTIDPRDQFNPGLVRITNGENMDGGMTMDRYHSTMLDKRWYKFRLQGGFSRSAVPLVWNVAQPVQDAYPGQIYFDTEQQGNQLMSGSGGFTKNPVKVDSDYSIWAADNLTGKISISNISSGSSSAVTSTGLVNGPNNNTLAPSHSDIGQYPLYVEQKMGGTEMMHQPVFDSRYMIQNQRMRLGWMPTDVHYTRVVDVDGTPMIQSVAGYAPIPEVELMTFVLPQAYKTKFYYRVFVETTVYFKDPVVIDPFLDPEYDVGNLPVDRFTPVPFLGGSNVDYPSYGSPITPPEPEGGTA